MEGNGWRNFGNSSVNRAGRFEKIAPFVFPLKPELPNFNIKNEGSKLNVLH